ncbi:MAG: ABC transporter substrate-binding protein [Omnitrophica bacterium]|nr:ABC transporter substrate-binding protein [Candidatus Omnitrophota bacterium]
MGKKVFLLGFLSFFLLVPGLVNSRAFDYRGKKILFINSYHKEYYWSDGEQAGVERVLAGSGVELKVVYMDTKNNPGEKFKRKAGLKVKKIIEKFKPDVVIAADDNAFKYVIMPYYRDADLPVVFCGLNWDISVYDAPYSNTTGMIEVGLYEGIHKHLKRFAQGDRVGFIGVDVLSSYKNADYFSKQMKDKLVFKEHVRDFKSWKKKYLEAQDKVDMLILDTAAGIKNWNAKEAEKFVLENIRIPIGTESVTLASHSLIGLTKVPQEQGEYAAAAALRILKGEKPSEIPLVTNKKGDLFLNIKIAGKLDIIFTLSMLKNAKEIIGVEY